MSRSWKQERTAPKQHRQQGTKQPRKGLSHGGQYQEQDYTVTARSGFHNGLLHEDNLDLLSEVYGD